MRQRLTDFFKNKIKNSSKSIFNKIISNSGIQFLVRVHIIILEFFDKACHGGHCIGIDRLCDAFVSYITFVKRTQKKNDFGLKLKCAYAVNSNA